MKDRLTVIGLTGGISSGKSTVARGYREIGVPVLDADELGHVVLEPDGEAFDPVIEAFGSSVLDDNGRIDRQKLGAQVFDDTEARKRLELITHPAIARLAKKGMLLIAESGVPLAFYEAALLVETGVHESLDGLVVVSCTLEQQLRRTIARDGLSKEAAAVRIAAQLPLEEKLEVANWVIHNDRDWEKMRVEATKVLDEIRTRFKIETS